jgi:DNA polymerase-3 subunit gamma/tau
MRELSARAAAAGLPASGGRPAAPISDAAAQCSRQAARKACWRVLAAQRSAGAPPWFKRSASASEASAGAEKALWPALSRCSMSAPLTACASAMPPTSPTCAGASARASGATAIPGEPGCCCVTCRPPTPTHRPAALRTAAARQPGSPTAGSRLRPTGAVPVEQPPPSAPPPPAPPLPAAPGRPPPRARPTHLVALQLQLLQRHRRVGATSQRRRQRSRAGVADAVVRQVQDAQPAG